MKRRHNDTEVLKPIHEIQAEATGADQVVKPLVGRHDNPHIRVALVILPHPPICAILQHAQQSSLRTGGEFGHLIDEERAALRLFDQAGAIGLRARKRPPGMPENLTLEEFVREDGGVDRDKLPPGSRRQIVNRARDLFLAGPGLAVDRDCHIRRRGPADDGREATHCVGGTDQPGKKLRRHRIVEVNFGRSDGNLGQGRGRAGFQSPDLLQVGANHGEDPPVAEGLDRVDVLAHAIAVGGHAVCQGHTKMSDGAKGRIEAGIPKRPAEEFGRAAPVLAQENAPERDMGEAHGHRLRAGNGCGGPRFAQSQARIRGGEGGKRSPHMRAGSTGAIVRIAEKRERGGGPVQGAFRILPGELSIGEEEVDLGAAFGGSETATRDGRGAFDGQEGRVRVARGEIEQARPPARGEMFVGRERARKKTPRLRSVLAGRDPHPRVGQQIGPIGENLGEGAGIPEAVRKPVRAVKIMSCRGQIAGLAFNSRLEHQGLDQSGPPARGNREADCGANLVPRLGQPGAPERQLRAEEAELGRLPPGKVEARLDPGLRLTQSPQPEQRPDPYGLDMPPEVIHHLGGFEGVASPLEGGGKPAKAQRDFRAEGKERPPGAVEQAPFLGMDQRLGLGMTATRDERRE